MKSWLSLFVLTAILSGCASQAVLTPTETNWNARQAIIEGMQDWRIQGRVALSVDGEGGNGRMSWIQDHEQLELMFRGPFGAGGFRVYGSLAQLTLTTKAGDTFLSSDPQTDLLEQVGWSVPIESLGYWMRGIPDPERPVGRLDVDEVGLLRQLRQGGWQVTYERYRPFNGRNMPRKLALVGDNVKLKVAVDRWTWGAGPPD